MKDIVNDLRFLLRELEKVINQFWNFGKRGEIFLPLEDVKGLYDLLARIANEVKLDKKARLEQF